MQGLQVPFVAFPRYTSILGGGPPWFTAPIPCVEFSRVTLEVWHGALLNTAVINAAFAESNDGVDFTPCGGGPWPLPGGIGQMQVSAPLTKAWFQFGLMIGGGANAGVTFWAEGFLERREK